MSENSTLVTKPSDAGVEGEGEGEDELADARNHLSDVEPGAGCTEIWEHLSETRDDAQE